MPSMPISLGLKYLVPVAKTQRRCSLYEQRGDNYGTISDFDIPISSFYDCISPTPKFVPVCPKSCPWDFILAHRKPRLRSPFVFKFHKYWIGDYAWSVIFAKQTSALCLVNIRGSLQLKTLTSCWSRKANLSRRLLGNPILGKIAKIL
jgi:hypothetical protein